MHHDQPGGQRGWQVLEALPVADTVLIVARHAVCYYMLSAIGILLVLLFIKFCTWSASCLVAVGALSLALMLYSPADDGWLVVVNWWWLAHQPSSRRWWST